MSESNAEANGAAEPTPPVVEMAQIALDIKEDGKSPPEKPSGNFKETFRAFSKFGDCKSDGKHITLSQSDKWMKQAKVIDKKITTTDTAIHFKKLKQMKVTYDDYCKFLEDLANTKKVELAQIRSKMANCGQPGVSTQVTPGKASSTVERLTDVKKFTGSHKERFDTSTGKGKGTAGRKDLVDNSGYVSGYTHKDTFDKTH